MKDELVSTNPATGVLIESHTPDTAADINRKLDNSARAAEGWAATSVSERAGLLRAVAATLRADLDRHATAMVIEMGKPIAEARAEVEKCAFACDYFAEHAARFLGDESAASDSPRSYIAFEPLGTLLACMPWNFPYWQVFRCAAPALAAGNCIVLKHANNVTRCGRLIEEVFRAAGMETGVFALLAVPIAAVAGLIADPRVAAVSLTGSTAAGRSVGETAGRNLRSACSSWADRTRSSCSTTPTSIALPRSGRAHAFRTPDRAASRRSGSSSPTRSPARSRSALWCGHARSPSAILQTRRPRWARWRVPTCAKHSSVR